MNLKQSLFKHSKTIFLPVCLLALFAIGGCSTNPVTGKNELMLMSTAGEIETGEQHYLPSQQVAGGRYTADAALGEYVSTVGRRVAAVSDRALPYEFVVLNNSTPNAWALPGGKIAIHRGLLVELESEAELAAVLSHEIVHAAAKHGAHAMQRGLLLEGILLAVSLAGKDTEYANYVIGGATLALHLTKQKYSRDAERASDYHGMKYLHAAGYDTASAVTLQEKFVALSQDNKTDWVDGLLASHPASTERVADNRQALAEFPAGGTLGRDRYQQKLAYLRTHQDAYQQAQHARRESNPESALNAIDNAIKQEPREALFYGIKGDILASQKRYREATRAYDAAIERDSVYYEHFLGRALAYNQLGQRQQARTDFERSNNLLPTAVATYNLGSIALVEGDREYAKRLFADARMVDGKIGNVANQAFVKLDIADTPERYVDVEVFFEDGQVLIEVKNLTAYALSNIVVGVNAKINQDSTSRQPTLTQLAANATKTLPSGIRYRDEDGVEVEAWVMQADSAH